MPELTGEQLARRAVLAGLLSKTALEKACPVAELRHLGGAQLGQRLVQQGLLTDFQLALLNRGDKQGFFYGDYLSLYPLGGGGFARVFRGRHKKTHRDVAIKVLRNRFSAVDRYVEQFRREGTVGLNLHHPNIVRTYEVAHDGPPHYFVMEFVEGSNLREFLSARGKLNPLEATRLMRDVVQGLKYAADLGIAHRDLRLSNILISSKGEAKVSDFGLAGTYVTLGTDDPLAERTLEYGAFERTTGSKAGDPRTDIFFAGCLYYHMLTGTPPLGEATTHEEKVSAVRFRRVKPILDRAPDIPWIAAAIVTKALELLVDRRYQNFGQMLVDLTAAQEQLGADFSALTYEPRSAARHDHVLLHGEVSTDELPSMCGSRSLEGHEDLSHALDALRAAEAPRQPTVLVVEADPRLQDAFRDGLKKLGYDVLLMSDPERALRRIDVRNCEVDFALFSTIQLGAAAVEGFCRLASSRHVRGLPAALLLDDQRADWQQRVAPHLTERRVRIPLPIRFKEVAAILRQLVPPPEPGSAAHSALDHAAAADSSTGGSSSLHGGVAAGKFSAAGGLSSAGGGPPPGPR